MADRIPEGGQPPQRPERKRTRSVFASSQEPRRASPPATQGFSETQLGQTILRLQELYPRKSPMWIARRAARELGGKTGRAAEIASERARQQSINAGIEADLRRFYQGLSNDTLQDIAARYGVFTARVSRIGRGLRARENYPQRKPGGSRRRQVD